MSFVRCLVTKPGERNRRTPTQRDTTAVWTGRVRCWCTVHVVSLLDRITVDAQVCHGAPTVRGLRYPVEMIVGLLASGMTTDEVLADYPDLVADDVLASLEYAALVTRTRSSVPIPAA